MRSTIPNDSISLKKAALESAELLANFLKSSFIDAYHDVHSEANIEAYCNEFYTREHQEKAIADTNYDIYFALKAGKEVGVLVINHQSCHLRPELKSSELKQIYLRSSEYGTGLGKSLMEHAYKLIASRGNEWVWLCVSDLNHRAQRFYEKSNFQRIGKGPILKVGTERLPSSIMIRQLNL